MDVYMTETDGYEDVCWTLNCVTRENNQSSSNSLPPSPSHPTPLLSLNTHTHMHTPIWMLDLNSLLLTEHLLAQPPSVNNPKWHFQRIISVKDLLAHFFLKMLADAFLWKKINYRYCSSPLLESTPTSSVPWKTAFCPQAKEWASSECTCKQHGHKCVSKNSV